jgi:hypothetical protein
MSEWPITLEVPGFGVAAKDTKFLTDAELRIPRQCYSAKIGWQVKTNARWLQAESSSRSGSDHGPDVGWSMIFSEKPVPTYRVKAGGHAFRDHALKPPRQQIAQQRRAGAKKRKCGDRDTDFKSERKRPLRRVERTEYLDERGHETDAGAVEPRAWHVPGSRTLFRSEKRWKHRIVRQLHRSYRRSVPMSRAAPIALNVLDAFGGWIDAGTKKD